MCITVLFKTAFRNDYAFQVIHIRSEAMEHTLPFPNNLSNHQNRKMQVYLAHKIFKFVLTFSQTKTQKSKSICNPLVTRGAVFSIKQFKEFGSDLDW